MADPCSYVSLQIKRVVDPEAEALRMAEMRRLQRQMKGIKLQYIAEDDTVFFSDVAGIGEAKVCLTMLSLALPPAVPARAATSAEPAFSIGNILFLKVWVWPQILCLIRKQ